MRLEQEFRSIRPWVSDGAETDDLGGQRRVDLSHFFYDLAPRKSVTGIACDNPFVLAKLNHVAHLRIGEYVALIAAADASGHSGVGVLLESCLADKLAFVERTRRLIRNAVETKIAERAAGASA